MDIVLANGTALTTNSNSNSDLFWALRGGGGASFGVVTHFTANLFKVPTASMFFFKFTCAAEVIHLWQTFFVTAPNELNAQFKMSKSDSWINGQFEGPMTGPTGLQALIDSAGILSMKSLLWYQFRTCSGLSARAFVIGGLDCSPEDLNLLTTFPIEPTAKDRSKSKTDNFNSLMPQHVLDAITDMLLQDENGDIYGHSLGGDGVFASQPPSATAFDDRSAWYTLEYHYTTPSSSTNTTTTTTTNYYYPGSTSYIWLRSLSDLVKPYTSGRKYLNYQDFDLPPYYGLLYWGWDNFQRLIQVKNKYDPTNFFNNPQSIPLSMNYSSFVPTTTTSSAPTLTWSPTSKCIYTTPKQVNTTILYNNLPMNSLLVTAPSMNPTACTNNVLSQCGGATFVSNFLKIIVYILLFIYHIFEFFCTRLGRHAALLEVAVHLRMSIGLTASRPMPRVRR